MVPFLETFVRFWGVYSQVMPRLYSRNLYRANMGPMTYIVLTFKAISRIQLDMFFFTSLMKAFNSCFDQCFQLNGGKKVLMNMSIYLI